MVAVVPRTAVVAAISRAAVVAVIAWAAVVAGVHRAAWAIVGLIVVVAVVSAGVAASCGSRT